MTYPEGILKPPNQSSNHLKYFFRLEPHFKILPDIIEKSKPFINEHIQLPNGEHTNCVFRIGQILQYPLYLSEIIYRFVILFSMKYPGKKIDYVVSRNVVLAYEFSGYLRGYLGMEKAVALIYDPEQNVITNRECIKGWFLKTPVCVILEPDEMFISKDRLKKLIFSHGFDVLDIFTVCTESWEMFNYCNSLIYLDKQTWKQSDCPLCKNGEGFIDINDLYLDSACEMNDNDFLNGKKQRHVK
jgi:hypothetical protein